MRKNPYLLFIKKETKKTLKEKWSLKTLSNRYRLLTDGKKEELIDVGLQSYRDLYNSISDRYYSQNLIIPQFLNPKIDEDSIVSIGDRALWAKVTSQRKGNV